MPTNGTGNPVRRWLSVRRNQFIAGGIAAVVLVVVIAAVAGGSGGGGSKQSVSAPPAKKASSGANGNVPPPTIPTTTTTTPAPQQASGDSDQVVNLTFPTTMPALVHATYQGDSNFIVHGVNSLGVSGSLLVNVIGAYDGVTPLNFTVDEQATALQVQAQGPWTITVSPLSTAPEVPAHGSYMSSSDQVIGIAAGTTLASFGYSGDSNFIVHAVTGTQETLVVNEIGAFNGQEVIPAGTLYLIVEAQGSWSVTLG